MKCNYIIKVEWKCSYQQRLLTFLEYKADSTSLHNNPSVIPRNLADNTQTLCHDTQIPSSSPSLPHISSAFSATTPGLSNCNSHMKLLTVPEYAMLPMSLCLCLFCSLSLPSFNLLPNLCSSFMTQLIHLFFWIAFAAHSLSKSNHCYLSTRFNYHTRH